MATAFPAALDAFSNPAPTTFMNVLSHSSQHSDENDAVEAIEAKLGIGASTPVVNTVLAGTGAGTSSYSGTPTLTGLRIISTFTPNASDGAALGSTSLMWSDLFLASGGVINFNNGAVTITHSATGLSIAGGNVGLGTSTLSARLCVSGTAAENPEVRIYKTQGAAGAKGVVSFYNGDDTGARWEVGLLDNDGSNFFIKDIFSGVVALSITL